jgi:hypothetical protein
MSSVSDPSSIPRRPFLVSAILALYIFLALVVVALPPPWIGRVLRQSVHYSWFHYAQSSALMLLKLTAATLLFRLRRLAVPIFFGVLALDIGMRTFDAATSVPSKTPSLTTPAASILGLAFYGVICVYAWSLARRGVLR